MSELTIKKEIVINAARETVFDALTKSAQIIKYFPLNEVISSWQVGSEVLYKGEVDGAAFTDFGINYRATKPSFKLQLSLLERQSWHQANAGKSFAN